MSAEEGRGLKEYWFGGRLSRLLSAYVEPKSHIMRILAGLALLYYFALHLLCYYYVVIIFHLYNFII